MKLARIFLASVMGAGLVCGTVAARAEEPEQVKRPDRNELLKDEHAHDKEKVQTKNADTAKKPTTATVKIAPAAQEELDAITAAYQKLTTLEVAGTVTEELAAGDDSQSNRAAFTGSFAAPNKFRHEMKGDLVIGSTGEKLYAYRPWKNDYHSADAPKERAPASKLANPMRELLWQQDIGLMCAVVDDAGQLLIEGMKAVTREPDAQLAGRTYAALAFKGDKVDYRLLVDSQTHLVRRAVVDMKRAIQSRGREDVTRALYTFDYTTVAPGAQAADDKQFAWAAPEGARDAATAAAEEGDAVALVGKDAPDFTLNGMDGQPVKLSEQRGSVVVLDFWATWCGPCRASLPGLNKLYKEMKEKGMKAFAVDLEEPKDTIQPVAKQLIPDIPVLLDEKSEVAKSFGVSGIPQTVVIGKDGKVRKVLVGSGNEANIKAAVEKALAE